MKVGVFYWHKVSKQNMVLTSFSLKTVQRLFTERFNMQYTVQALLGSPSASTSTTKYKLIQP